MKWHILTGEYPPEPGGVADYTALLASALACEGHEAHVWCPGEVAGAVDESGVSVHRIVGGFGPAGLGRLGRELDRFPGPRTILIQYVPHAYGWRAMNLPFAAWALSRRVRRRDDVRVMFHEVAFPWVARPLRHNLLAAVNRAMAVLLIRASSRVYISTLGWGPRLRRLGAWRTPITWTAVPSNVPEGICAGGVVARRAELTRGDPAARVVCHFGTYGQSITRTLGPALRELLVRRPGLRVLLLGAGGEQWRRGAAEGLGDWPDRVIAPGPLPAPAITALLGVCDLAIQPYPDGVSSRRSTVMAALANGVPVVTTLGEASEPDWSDGAVAIAPIEDPGRLAQLALDLLDRPGRLAELGRAGKRLYEERFALRHTLTALLDPP